LPATLILLQDEKPVSEFALDAGRPLIVGRSSDATLQVRDVKLSRHHCEFRASAEGCFVCDLGSKNGTFVNGARITEARLRDGDRIQVGLARFLFRDEPVPVRVPATETQPAAKAGRPGEETHVAPPRLCASCGRIVPVDEIGSARQTASRIYCPPCLGAQPLLGRTIGGYELVQRIGRGSIGTVFKAEQLSMTRPVALKILHAELASDPEAARRFLREARAAGLLSHPHILRIYDMNQAEGYFFISMEYVPGGDIGALLERVGPLPCAQVVETAAQVCGALAHAHAKGILHRDLKPSNLLLGRDGLIKVADLGFAKGLDAAGLGALVGSSAAVALPLYASPEQLADPRSADARADLYSLGAICYHLLSGEPPFGGASAPELAAAIRAGRLRPLRAYRADVPLALDDALARALARDPARRYQSADEFQAALKAVRL
jgi:serine/threonine-protein kinase